MDEGTGAHSQGSQPRLSNPSHPRIPRTCLRIRPRVHPRCTRDAGSGREPWNGSPEPGERGVALVLMRSGCGLLPAFMRLSRENRNRPSALLSPLFVVLLITAHRCATSFFSMRITLPIACLLLVTPLIHTQSSIFSRPPAAAAPPSRQSRHLPDITAILPLSPPRSSPQHLLLRAL